MSENKNEIKIFSDKIGEFKVVVDDHQLDKLIRDGAKTLNQIKEEDKSRRWRRPGDGFGSSDTEDGFTGNTVDWSKYFPEVSGQEIDKMIAEALDYERKVRAATSAALILVGVGVSAALTGNPASALGLVKVIQILGSYFSEGTDSTLDTENGSNNI